jgi:alpha-tubulin suppressor-like RCC1 family protein
MIAANLEIDRILRIPRQFAWETTTYFGPSARRVSQLRSRHVRRGMVLGRELAWSAWRQHDARQQRARSGRRRTTLHSLAVGWNFTCGLDSDGHAFCWGDDTAGELGDGANDTDRRVPTPVVGGLSFTSIAAGNAHACGITVQGDAYCWGRNGSGQLGDGSTADHSSPGRVKGSAGFASITAGGVHTCAVDTHGEAFCWGRNTYGQLGDGGTTDQTIPARVAGAHAFSSVRAFGSHTCGATVSGEAFCWGYNLDGQLGDGTRTHRTRPVYIEPPSGS